MMLFCLRNAFSFPPYPPRPFPPPPGRKGEPDLVSAFWTGFYGASVATATSRQDCVEAVEETSAVAGTRPAGCYAPATIQSIAIHYDRLQAILPSQSPWRRLHRRRLVGARGQIRPSLPAPAGVLSNGHGRCSPKGGAMPRTHKAHAPGRGGIGGGRTSVMQEKKA